MRGWAPRRYQAGLWRATRSSRCIKMAGQSAHSVEDGSESSPQHAAIQRGGKGAESEQIPCHVARVPAGREQPYGIKTDRQSTRRVDDDNESSIRHAAIQRGGKGAKNEQYRATWPQYHEKSRPKGRFLVSVAGREHNPGSTNSAMQPRGRADYHRSYGRAVLAASNSPASY